MRQEFDSPTPHKFEVETNSKNLINNIPKEVLHVTQVLENANFEVFLVGGCVRDLVMGKIPKDWDLTTNAKPEEIIPLFDKTIYENNFGTVGICIPVIHETPINSNKQENYQQEDVNHETKPEYLIVEVTTYRIEQKYSDFRHPDEILFSNNLEDDLKRRDFTMNALALNTKGQITDMFWGLKDIENKIINTVGQADDRFSEDALRMLRAIRFSCQLQFSVSYQVLSNIEKNSALIENISQERIRDEFVKIIMSPTPSMGIAMLQKTKLLKYIIPELSEGINCEQGGAHKFDVFEHLLQALQHAADKNWSLEIRLSALFHDIGKPKTRRASAKASFPQVLGSPRQGLGQTIRKTSFASAKPYTFYGHEVVGARMVKKIMERMKFSRDEINFVESMVRNHMFFSDTEQITLSAVRRIIVKVGKENIWHLMNVRECDRVGMAKKEAPYRLRKYHAMIEECLRDPISVSQLKIDGGFLINEIGMKPGPRMGWILNALLEEVLENPEKNETGYLKNRVGELENFSDKDLRALGEKAKEKKEELEEMEVEKLHSKHGVRK